MHRSDLMKKFIDKVNDEAEKAAQKVFDSYQQEFEDLIRREKIKGEAIVQAMGIATYYKIEDPSGAEKFLFEISRAQYTEQSAGFETKNID